MSIRRTLVIVLSIGLSLILLTACKHSSPTATGTTASLMPSPSMQASPLPSQTPLPPTSTPIPLAALVNGNAITLDEYQAELARYQASTVITGTNLAPQAGTVVLNELIDQTLLAQSATGSGFIVDEAMLQTRIEALEGALGGSQALQDWKTKYGYSEDDFQSALRRAIAAAWMRDQIIAAVPETADQVHVIQILLPTAAEAQQVYSELQTGSDFLDLAARFDPKTGGDLGWFPLGYLQEPAVDEAVFALQVQQYSQVIETEAGFHVFYVAERDEKHPLLPDARYTLQVKSVADWLEEQRNQSEIEIFVP